MLQAEPAGRADAAVGGNIARYISHSCEPNGLGGFVAVQTALQYPARVARMVLLAPALRSGRIRVRFDDPRQRWEKAFAQRDERWRSRSPRKPVEDR